MGAGSAQALWGFFDCISIGKRIRMHLMVKGTFPSTELVKLPLLHYYLKKYPLTSYSRVIGILSDEKPLAL